MSEFNDLEKMLRLKRYEQPPEGYFEDFFVEFQSRQRSEMLRQSAHGLFFERVSTWLWGLGNRKWLYAGGALYACVMIWVFLNPVGNMLASNPETDSGAAPVTVEMKLPAREEQKTSELPAVPDKAEKAARPQESVRDR